MPAARRVIHWLDLWGKMVAIGEIVKWQRFCTLNNRGFMILERLLFFSGKSSPPLQSWSLHIVSQFCADTLIVIRPLSLKSKIKMKLLVLIFIGFRARRRVRFINIISPRGQTEVSHTIRLRYLHLDGRFMFEIRPPADHSLYTAGTL